MYENQSAGLNMTLLIIKNGGGAGRNNNKVSPINNNERFFIGCKIKTKALIWLIDDLLMVTFLQTFKIVQI